MRRGEGVREGRNQRKLIKIPSNYMSIFIGIILSDANISKSNKSDARLQFRQSIKHIAYFYSVFMKLSHYCSPQRGGVLI